MLLSWIATLHPVISFRFQFRCHLIKEASLMVVGNIPISWYSHPYIIHNTWTWAEFSDLPLENKIRHRWWDHVTKRLASILVTLSFFHLPTHSEGDQLPYCELPYGEAHMAGSEGGLQPIASKKLRSSIQQPEMNGILPRFQPTHWMQPPERPWNRNTS